MMAEPAFENNLFAIGGLYSLQRDRAEVRALSILQAPSRGVGYAVTVLANIADTEGHAFMPNVTGCR